MYRITIGKYWYCSNLRSWRWLDPNAVFSIQISCLVEKAKIFTERHIAEATAKEFGGIVVSLCPSCDRPLENE